MTVVEATGTDAAATDPSDGAAPRRRAHLPGWRRAWLAMAVAIVVASCAVLLVTLHVDGWTQVANEADQIWAAQTTWERRPLVGDFTTSNFYGNEVVHHPGPMGFWLEAPFVSVLGARDGGWVFAIVVNASALLGAVVVAMRAGGGRAGAVLLVAGLAGFSRAIDGQFASSFFQDLPILSLFCCLVLCWALARGDVALGPPLALVASFVVQLETLYLPIVALAVTGAVASCWLAVRRRPGVRRIRPWVVLTSVVLAVLWCLPAYDLLFGTGNLVKLLSISVPHSGWAGAWLSVRSVVPWFLVPLALVAVALVVGHRTWRRHLPLAVVSVATIVGSGVAGWLLPHAHELDSHRIWQPMCEAFVVASLCIVVLTEVRMRHIVEPLVLVVSLVVAGLLSPTVWSPRTDVPRDRASMDAVHHLLPALTAEVPPGEPVLVGARGGWFPAQVASGLLPQLRERGRASWTGPAKAREAEVTYVVTRGRTAPGRDHDLLASYVPPTPEGLDTDLEARLAGWIRSQGPLELTPEGRTNLVNLVDGLAPELCVDELVADPSRLVDLAPDAAARLYALGWVATPALPPELISPLAAWDASQRIDLLRVVTRATPRGPLILSRSVC